MHVTPLSIIFILISLLVKNYLFDVYIIEPLKYFYTIMSNYYVFCRYNLITLNNSTTKTELKKKKIVSLISQSLLEFDL